MPRKKICAVGLTLMLAGDAEIRVAVELTLASLTRIWEAKAGEAPGHGG